MDHVFNRFLENTFLDAIELARKSDVLHLTPVPPYPPAGYLCGFDTAYLCRGQSGLVEVHPGPVLAAVRFPNDYLRSVDPELYLKVAAVLTSDFTHPNVAGLNVCLGSAFAPGTPLTTLLWELYDIVSYRNVTTDEANALNPEACRLLREHGHLIDQLSPPPFLRTEHELKVKVTEAK